MLKKLLVTILFSLTFASPAMAEPAVCKVDCNKQWCTTNFCAPFLKEGCEAYRSSCNVLAGVHETYRTHQDKLIFWVRNKCGGEVCDLLRASVSFVDTKFEGSNRTIDDVERQLREGKVVDAIWTFVTSPARTTEEALAKAALESNFLRTVGQVAAGVYGGPQGAAAYSAWLAYRETNDFEFALKVGIVSFAASHASAYADKVGAEGFPDAALRTGMKAAIFGASVAAMGGDEKQIQEAIKRGAIANIIREGYRAYTSWELDERVLKSSVRRAYCLAVNPDKYEALIESGLSNEQRADLDGCFAGEAWSRQSNGQWELNFKDLDPTRPHVGIWSDSEPPKVFGIDERSGFMTTVSRIPGMNAMSLPHDIFAGSLDFSVGWAPEWIADSFEYIVSVGTIPVFTVLTYEGTGVSVHELIRSTYRPDLIWPEYNRSRTGREEENALLPSSTELLVVSCSNQNSETPKFFRLEAVLNTPSLPTLGYGVCSLEQQTQYGMKMLWHAHSDRSSCHKKLTQVLQRQVRIGYQCTRSAALVEYDQTIAAPGFEVSIPN